MQAKFPIWKPEKFLGHITEPAPNYLSSLSCSEEVKETYMQRSNNADPTGNGVFLARGRVLQRVGPTNLLFDAN